MGDGSFENSGGRVVDSRPNRGEHVSRDAARSEGHTLRILSISDCVSDKNQPVPGSDGERPFSEPSSGLHSEQRTCQREAGMPAARVHEKREAVAARSVFQASILKFGEKHAGKAVRRKIGETALKRDVQPP